jgi:hypothetical protein
MRVIRALSVIAAVAVLGPALTAWASGTMQKAPSGSMQKAPTTQQKAPTSGAAPAIKVEAQSLTVTPSAPQAGQQVTVKFVFKNTGTGTVAKVPWSIHLYTSNQTLKTDNKTNLEPGATYEASATWTPGSAGTYKVQGYIDPTGKELKNTAPVSAQIKELDVNVAAAATATSTARLVTQLLDYQSAKRAGAQFGHNVDGATGCINVGQEDLKATGWALRGRGESGVVFSIDCAPGGIPAPTGGRATPEAFTGLPLKNGWKVKAVEILDEIRVGTGEWLWRQRPSLGATDAGMKMHVWANAGGRYAVSVKVTIEGPEGSNPYE